MEMVSRLPRLGTITREGSPLTLSCSSSSPWFFCLWHSPIGGKQCAIQEDQVTSVCGEGGERTLHSASHSSCSLSIARVSREDHGNWMCLLNDITEFDTVKERVKVEVGVEAVGVWGAVDGLEGGVLSLVEGEEREVVCEGRQGYPAPSFLWDSHKPDISERERRGKSEERDGSEVKEVAERSVELELFNGEEEEAIPLNTTSKVTLLQSGGHLYHGQQSLRYVGRLQDHGTNLTCTVVQLDHLGTVLYSSTISIQLEVSELVIYSQGSGVLEERIGIISGIILAVIFIILIFILTALLLTRRRKKVPKYESVNGEKGSDEMLAPIWRPAGRRTNVAVVSTERQFDSHYLEEHLDLDLKEQQRMSMNNKTNGYARIPTHEAAALVDHCRCGNGGERDLLNTSLESGGSGCGSGGSGENSGGGGNSLSRPTTRTTKTISSASDSSRSSIMTTDRSLREGGEVYTYVNFQPEILNCELARQGSELSPTSFQFSPNSMDKFSSPTERHPSDQTGSRPSSRLHETHFGSSVNSIPCTVVHSPMEASSLLSPDQLHLTPISTIENGRRTAPGHERGRRSVVAGEDDGGGAGRPPMDGSVRHIQLASTRLFPLGPNAPIDRMPHVQFRPNGTIFDCELGCFIPLAEYQRRRSKESLASVKEEEKE